MGIARYGWLAAAVSWIGLALTGCDRSPSPPAPAKPPAKSTTTSPNSVNQSDEPSTANAVDPADADQPVPKSSSPPNSSPPKNASPGNPLRSPGSGKTVPANGGKSKAKPAVDSPQPGQARLPIFEGWPKPDAVLVVTGRQNGYLEPCGCAGLVNQKGGLARRLTMVRELNQRGWPVAAFDVGNQVKRYGRQSEIKFQAAIEGLRQMDYLAIGFGPDDLRLTTGDLLAVAAEEPRRFVSANVTVLDPEVAPPFKIVEVGGLKIGVTTVLGDEYLERVKSDEVQTRPAAEGLAAAAAELKKQSCDWQVLLAYASSDETAKLASQFPQFQIVVTAGGAEEPALEPERLPGSKSPLVQVGAKGMYAGVIGLYRQGGTPWRYQRVPLDDRFADAPEMLRLLAAYQDQLREAGLEGLGLRAVAHGSGRSFVGSKVCGECHTKAYEVWEGTGHARATQSLVKPAERSEIPRHFDPECLSCHVTGWEPQQMFPFKSGYLSLEATPAMLGSGCENCHGPGGAHVAAEQATGKSDQGLVARLRRDMQLPLDKAQARCIECHDHDNSPKFHHEKAFEEYWRRVAHPGKD